MATSLPCRSEGRLTLPGEDLLCARHRIMPRPPRMWVVHDPGCVRYQKQTQDRVRHAEIEGKDEGEELGGPSARSAERGRGGRWLELSCPDRGQNARLQAHLLTVLEVPSPG